MEGRSSSSLVLRQMSVGVPIEIFILTQTENAEFGLLPEAGDSTVG
jgi:hypothetical protein